MLALFFLQVFVPYITEKMHDIVERQNWSDPANRQGSLSLRLRYALARLLRLVSKLAQVADFFNFAAYMAGN